MKHTKWPSALAYDEMKNGMMKWKMEWWNEQWNDETLEGLSKSVKTTKWPSELAYDEMNIYVKRGVSLWRENVLMLINVWTTWYEGNVKDKSNLKWA